MTNVAQSDEGKGVLFCIGRKSFSLFLFVGNFYLEWDWIVSDTFSVSTGVAIYFLCSIPYEMCYIICDVLYKLLFIC